MIATACYSSIFGQVIESLDNEWLQHPNQKDLKNICTSAFKATVLLVYEAAVTGEDLKTYEILDAQLESYSLKWHIAVNPKQSNPAEIKIWEQNIRIGKENIFGLTFSDNKLSARVLKLCINGIVHIGSLNSEAVK
ncbi:hypothetical protein HK096_006085, partial [Nowakowskiella sp. JEL0078]